MPFAVPTILAWFTKAAVLTEQPTGAGQSKPHSSWTCPLSFLVWLSSVTHLGPRDKPCTWMGAWEATMSGMSAGVKFATALFSSSVQLQHWFPGVSITKRQCEAAAHWLIPWTFRGFSACACHLSWFCFQLFLSSFLLLNLSCPKWVNESLLTVSFLSEKGDHEGQCQFRGEQCLFSPALD